MESSADSPNPNNGRRSKPKIVVIMGATGTGKSRLAIDLAAHFPVEIINADSMQVYRGLDVLTNKVSLHEQKGVQHHLLGCVSPSVEFTAKDFRDAAVPIIDDVLSRNCLPVIVGGTNYYIQALVSPYLLDDSFENLDDSAENLDVPSFSTTAPGDYELEKGSSFGLLSRLDPVSARRLHPNDHRKINQYLQIYASSDVLPSELFRGKAVENWGRVDRLRYNCCFICVDADLPTIDGYVNHRVDCMITAGLLDEVCDIYIKNADYTRGLRQAIGVREFEKLLKLYQCELNMGLSCDMTHDCGFSHLTNNSNCKNLLGSLNSFNEKVILQQAIEAVKLHTRRLVRRQKRRINRLQSLFRWKIHFVDVAESFSSSSDDSWDMHVVHKSVAIIRSFLNDYDHCEIEDMKTMTHGQKILERDLWTQFTCEACGNKILRGSHEWEQHKQGRGHRKRISSLRKNKKLVFEKQQR